VIGGACSTYGRDDKCIYIYIYLGRKNMKGRDHLEDIGVGWEKISEWILEKEGRKMWTGNI